MPRLIDRTIIEAFDTEFARWHERSCKLIGATPAHLLYSNAKANASPAAPKSVCEYVLRGAAAVEQTFGGLTCNLWDDPFEWTLPETLSTPNLILDYLREVEETRRRAFAAFASDIDLLKRIATPAGEQSALISLLLNTLVRALDYQGRAMALAEASSLPRALGLSSESMLS